MIGAKRHMRCAGWLGLVAAVLAAGHGAFAGDQPALDVHDQQAMAALVNDLGSGDFNQREQAQKRLESIPSSQKDDLRRLAEQINDPEVQARLLGRVDMIEELAATDPPPISLDVKYATIHELAAALTEALGKPVIVRNGNEDDRFTLSAKGLHFWEIEDRLSAQHPIFFDMSGPMIYLMSGAQWRRNVVMRGLSVGISNLSWQPANAGQILIQGNGGVLQIINGPGVNGLVFNNGGVIRVVQANAGVLVINGAVNVGNLQANAVLMQGVGQAPAVPAGPKLAGVLTLSADPRIHVLSVAGPDLVQAVDDAGNRLVPPANGIAGSRLTNIVRGNSLSRSFALDAPEKIGRSIKTLRGEARVTVALQEKRIEVTDPEKHIGEILYKGDREVTLQDFALNANNNMNGILRVQVRGNQPRTATLGGLPVNPGMAAQISAVQVSLLDSAGTVLVSLFVADGATTGAAFRPNGPGPFKVIVTVPEKTKEVVVPFEFKDLAVPRQGQ
jgi:hypothetical protein